MAASQQTCYDMSLTASVRTSAVFSYIKMSGFQMFSFQTFQDFRCVMNQDKKLSKEQSNQLSLDPFWKLFFSLDRFIKKTLAGSWNNYAMLNKNLQLQTLFA